MSTEWREHYCTEFVQGHIQRALDEQRAYTLGAVQTWMGQLRLQSPLEVAFAAWWAIVATWQIDDFLLVSQYDVLGKYRLDFIVALSGSTVAEAATEMKIAIELDGHEFHERTKQQVELRNVRDRELGDAGWIVLHFSGSEFHRDPLRCIEEVTSVALRRKYGWR
jgi:very-short-patch-repair endonuclease